jgi:hypothetical protein
MNQLFSFNVGGNKMSMNPKIAGFLAVIVVMIFVSIVPAQDGSTVIPFRQYPDKAVTNIETYPVPQTSMPALLGGTLAVQYKIEGYIASTNEGQKNPYVSIDPDDKNPNVFPVTLTICTPGPAGSIVYGPIRHNLYAGHNRISQ